MELDFELDNKTLTVTIIGEIDHHTSIQIREDIDREIERKSAKNIIFEFGSVTFMDSSGVGMIIGRYKLIKELGGKVAIVNLSPKIKRIFEISGLFKIIPYYGTLEEAKKSI